MAERSRIILRRGLLRLSMTLGMLLVCVAVSHAQAEPETIPAAKSAFQLPDGTVVFFTDQPDLKNTPPDAVLLTAKDYQALVDKSDKLNDLTQSPQPIAPSQCELHGSVVVQGLRSVARFTATYSFMTSSDNQVIALGGQRAFPTAAKLDGEQLPELKFSKTGLTARIDTAGKHQIVLDWDVPIGARANKQELGFDFDLPRAAITTLTFTPPKAVTELRVGTRVNGDANDVKRQTLDLSVLRPTKNQTGYPLGATELLELTWAMPSDSEASNEVVLKAETDVTVRFTDEEMITTAKIRLIGRNPEWTLRLPSNADLSEEPTDTLSAISDLLVPDLPMPMSPMPSILAPTDMKQPVWKFRPTNPSVSEWRVTATIREPRGNASKPQENFSVGPIDVVDAVEQSGLIQLFAPQTVRVAYNPGENVRQIDQTRPGDDFIAAFQYTMVRTKPKQEWNGPLLELEARPSPGFVRAQPRYQLRKTDLGWRLESTTTITPIRSRVEQLQIDIPAAWEGVEVGPPELISGIEVVEATAEKPRRFIVPLFTPQKAPFDLTLSATLPMKKAEPNAPIDSRVSIALPEFSDAEQSDAEVTAIVSDGVRVRGVGTERNGMQTGIKTPLLPVKGTDPLPDFTKVSAKFRKGVATVDLEWEPYRPNLSASMDVEVGLQRSQMIVVQTIRLKSKDRPIPPVTLQGPAEANAVPSDFRLEKIGPGEWLFTPDQADATEAVIPLTYGLPMNDDFATSQPQKVPIDIFWPTTATRCETRLRVWGAGSSLPLKRFDGQWLLLPPLPEPAPLPDAIPTMLQTWTRDQLPWLTLTGTGLNLPLTLDFETADNTLLPNAVIERGLLHVALFNDGRLAVRAQFVLSRWPADGLRIDLPTGTIPDIRIDSQAAKYTIDSTEEHPTQIRVAFPSPDNRAVRLDIGYIVPAFGTREATVRIAPPLFPRTIFRSPTRWQIFLPTDEIMMLLQSSVVPDFAWSWNGLLLAPTAGTSTWELEQWLLRDQASEETIDDALKNDPPQNTITLTQPELGMLKVYRVPRVGLIMGCSLMALTIGLIFSQLRPIWFGPLLALLGIGLTVAVMLWPQVTAQCLAAMEPGIVALMLILVVIGLLRWNHYRRIHHLPGFTRIPYDTGSRRVEVADRASTEGNWVPAESGSAAPVVSIGSSRSGAPS